jgi:hypothetical protein
MDDKALFDVHGLAFDIFLSYNAGPLQGNAIVSRH